MPPYQSIYFVRHAETMGAGTTYVGDPALTHRGETQSALTADHLEWLGVSFVYASPLLRAQQTATPLIRKLGAPARTLPLMSEIHLGDYPGDKVAGRERPMIEFGQWGGDPGPEFNRRVLNGFHEFLTDLRSRPNQDVAVISHGGTINVILDYVTGIPFNGHMRRLLANCSVSTLRVGPDSLSLEDVNYVDHLPYELLTPENERPLIADRSR